MDTGGRAFIAGIKHRLRFDGRMLLKVGPRGGLAGILFLFALLIGVFVGAVWVFNAPWWFALLMAGLSVLIVAGLRFVSTSLQREA